MENTSKKATIFEFSSYTFEPEQYRAIFTYTTKFENGQDITFSETIVFPDIPGLQEMEPGLQETLLQNLHIILGISYYKFYCATNIYFPYILSKQQARFWNTVYKKGLGEFFYKNNLDPKISLKFPFDINVKNKTYNLKKTGKLLVGIGGGKDSIVSAELLKQANLDITAFNVETGKSSGLIEKVIETAGIGSLKIQRILDEKVRQPHQYNGHIPISAIYAFLGMFASAAYGHDYFIVSNEHSSNFGNLTYKGLEVNHQWSKSFEFETLFSDYVRENISQSIGYFSLLRSFHEIRIVQLFSQHKQYFELFSSCNKNFTAKGNEQGKLWCGRCAKCVFAFTLLSAFVSKEELLNIFGQNLYQQESLLPLFKDILGLGTMKPFDCVGTFQEAKAALFLARKQFAKDFIVRQLGKKAPYSKEVFETNKETAIPDQFKLAVAQNLYILGYGKEGKITKQYLKKYYPQLKIGVGDLMLDKQYLKKQQNFDLAIKTPGIKKELVTIPYTTATNLFFSKILGKNIIIGVTGSKGKSTTASLIFHIIKSAGKDVQLLGNIGTPMLQALTAVIPADRMFVLELSSAQLDDIAYSPNIAVVTNLFPEHMDYHGNLKNYYDAKKNIIRFQKPEDYFVYNDKTTAWLKEYNGNAVLASKETFKSNLLGEHNRNNIGAAVAVANILQIPEQKIKEAIKTFKGLDHRLELVGKFKGIIFYDDAISTTPESTIMAIQALKNVDTIFLGGQDRGYNFSDLEKTIKNYTIKNIVLFPDSGKKIIKQKKGLNILKTKSMQEAVAFAYKHTKKGSVCLLSCASPSYSLWKNFEEKGDQFKKYVKAFSKK